MTRITSKINGKQESGVYKSVYKPMDAYLKKRADGKSDTYYLTYPVPGELQDVLGKRYERKSTGTNNLRDARRVAAEMVAQIERKFRVLRVERDAPVELDEPSFSAPVQVALSYELIDSFCERWQIHHLQADDRERFAEDSLDYETDEAKNKASLEFTVLIDEIDTYAKCIELDAREITAAGTRASSYPHVLDEAAGWADTLGYLIDDKDPLIAKYVRKFAAEKFTVAMALQTRKLGGSAPTPDIPEKYKGASLAQYKEKWLDQHIGGLAEKTKSLYSGRIDQFSRFLSVTYPEMNDLPMRAVEGRQVQAFVNFLMHEEKLHPDSIRDGHLPPLRSIFKFAVADGEAVSNPCATVMLSKLSKKTEIERSQPRAPYTVEFLNKFFHSSWYGVGTAGILRSPLYADLQARYWIPLMLLYHGLRPIEVCQMTVSDIYYADSLLCFSVSEDDDTGKVAKTLATRRGLPVHEKLLSLGFADFFLRRQKEAKPQDRLFIVLEGHADPAKWFTQVYNRYTRDFLGAAKNYTTHSFRHNWEDNRRAAQFTYGKDKWPPGMHFQISGRHDIEDEEGSAKDYGHKYPAMQMQPFLNLIWHKEVVLPMSFSEFEATAFVSESARHALVKLTST